MEKQYETLTKRDIEPGEKYVKEILANSGKTLATAFIIAQAPKVIKVVSSAVSSNVAAAGKVGLEVLYENL